MNIIEIIGLILLIIFLGCFLYIAYLADVQRNKKEQIREQTIEQLIKDVEQLEKKTRIKDEIHATRMD